ncbi:MAG: Abi family protein [Bacilli bacterium]|nr:Abi family protein [Bacilli bacterium]
MANKVFKTLDEQIVILKDRGLVIKDEEEARNILLRENYFFINGYRHLFSKEKGNDLFLDGTTFDELYSAFIFDRRIRNIYFRYLLVVENNIKSIISYQLSKNYGYKEKDYLNPNNFNQDPLRKRQINDVLNKMKRQIRVNGDKHTATVHYINKYGYIPMWILVKVLSFGIVSELYAILRYDDQKVIAEKYGLDTETLGIYLSLIANFRNLCAHEEILYDYRTQKVIPDCYIHSALNIEKDDGGYIYGKNDLFALMIMLKALLTDKEFRSLTYEIGYEIDILDQHIDVVPLESILNKIGFPNNWKDIIDL